jgi:hypothetical protein
MQQFNQINSTVNPEIFFDSATKEKIRRHLTDESDTITEDDLVNIKTEMTVVSNHTTAAAQNHVDYSV